MNETISVTRAILLAAGRGKRLQPYTDKTPKPLLVHRGKPTLDYVLDSLQQAGVRDIVLVTHHLHDQIEQYAQLRSARSSQRVQCVFQSHLFGTAHALQSVVEQVPDSVAAPFILSATNYLVPREFFPQLVDFHHSHDAQASVSMKALPESELEGRSSIRFDADQSILEIVEKPPAGTAPSSTGANLTFILPPEVIPFVENVPMSPRGEREVQHAINQWLAEGGQARGLLQPTPSEWQSP